MTVFDTALATLHADRNISTAAAFRRAAVAGWLPLRVIETTPSEETGSARARAKSVSIQAADLVDGPPLRNDFVELASTLYRVSDVTPDDLSLSYVCDLTLAPPQDIATVGTSEVGGPDVIG